MAAGHALWRPASGAGTAHNIDKIQGISRFLIKSPGHMLVRAHQHEFAAVKLARLWCFHVDNSERDMSLLGRFDDARDTRRRIEAKEGVTRTQDIVERTMPFQPQMRHPTPGDRGRRKRAHRVCGRAFVIVDNDRRAIVEVTEVEPTAAL